MTIEKLYRYKNIVPLTMEEEQAVFSELREQEEKNNKIAVERIQTNLLIQYKPIVFGAVNKMSGYALNKDELYSEAYLALSLAINSFDITHGSRFSSYGYRCIILTLYTYITKNYFMVNPCTSKKHKKLFFRLRGYLREEIQRTNNAVCGNDFFERVAIELETSVDVVKSMMSLMNKPYESMSKPIGGDELMLQDIIVDDAPIADDILQHKNLTTLHKNIINEGLNSLDSRTQDIIRCQVLMEDKLTLTELGERYGISRERVRQIRHKGLQKLEKCIKNTLRCANYGLSDIFPN